MPFGFPPNTPPTSSAATRISRTLQQPVADEAQFANWSNIALQLKAPGDVADFTVLARWSGSGRDEANVTFNGYSLGGSFGLSGGSNIGLSVRIRVTRNDVSGSFTSDILGSATVTLPVPVELNSGDFVLLSGDVETSIYEITSVSSPTEFTFDTEPNISGTVSIVLLTMEMEVHETDQNGVVLSSYRSISSRTPNGTTDELYVGATGGGTLPDATVVIADWTVTLG